MNNPIEQLVSLLAPHTCVGCNIEGSIVCNSCIDSQIYPQPSRCYRCHKATKQNKVCPTCKQKSSIKHVFVASSYDGLSKELVYRLKFSRAKSAAKVVVQAIDSNLPILPESTVVVHVPTVNQRVRIRGYDQSELIARHLSKIRKLPHKNLLLRQKSSRQVGSSRVSRFEQLNDAFAVNKKIASNSHILLIDDVVTTGATIESAAKTLKKAGFRSIDVAVFAQA